MSRRVVILGAAGRDFHNFNVVYRDDPEVEVVAFTATQIPGIDARRYPPELAGPRYPDGIPILPEAELEALCHARSVDEVVFAYSDVTHEHVMHRASRALATGADFTLLGPDRTALDCTRPVVAVSAVRTGCGKSQVARWLSERFREKGVRVAVLRHPMPYGDLARQRVQRFADVADLAAAACTVEEREEYEPHLALGHVVYAGVDYAAIVQRAGQEADVLLWDGGNNDFPFLRPDLHIVLADALRPAQIDTHHPGETNVRLADVMVVNKVDAAGPEALVEVRARVRAIRPDLTILQGRSIVRLPDGASLAGRRVLVVEDGPTLTHGGLPTGAGFAAATTGHAAEIVDPRESAPEEILAVYRAYPHIGPVLPAVGYGEAQRTALRATIERSRAEIVVAGTPIDLAAALDLSLPVVRVRYDFDPVERPALDALLESFMTKHDLLDRVQRP